MKKLSVFKQIKQFRQITKISPTFIRFEDAICNYYFIDNNKKENVVFVHGFGSNHLIYSFVSAEISKHYNIILISLPGFNNSTVSEQVSPTVEWYGDVISKLINRLPHNVDHIVLHSFSTMYAAKLSVQIKKETKTIVLAGFVTPKIAKKENFMEFKDVIYLNKKQYNDWTKFLYYEKLPLWFNLIVKKKSLRLQWKNLNHGVNLIIKNIMFFIKNKNIATYIPKKSNVFLIRGKYDRLTTLEMQNDVEKYLGTKKRTYIVDKCGHNPFFERPVETSKILREIFTRKISSFDTLQNLFKKKVIKK